MTEDGVSALRRDDRDATPGHALRDLLAAREVTAFIGIYDALSATIAGKHADTLFLSGYGFSASHYGLPDVGFIAWTDMLAFVSRVRSILPRHHLLVDLDDGYGDPEIAAHVVAAIERAGASGIILEDQQRPRRCGHAPGKQVLPLDQYLDKLKRVLAARRDMFVVARTDAADDDERVRRAIAFAEAGADAVLADGITDLGVLTRIARAVDKPVMFNQIAGGRSPAYTLTELRAAGVSLVNYSTPCLFAAMDAIERTLDSIKANDGLLRAPGETGTVGVADCTSLLTRNLSAPPTASSRVVEKPSTPDERIAHLSPAKQRLLAARRNAVPTKLIESDETAPVSRTQHWFWSATQVDPTAIALNTSRCIRLTGRLDVDRLKCAIRAVVQRHAILRTTYEQLRSDDAPRQRVRACPTSVALPLIDLTAHPPAERDDASRQAIAAEARRPFDLSTGPVWRATLIRLGPTEHVLLLTVHHIAFDGWSVGVWQRDLAAAYEVPDVALAPLTWQYADYAAWQRGLETAESIRVDEDYWSRQLAGTRPLDLPTDRPRPPVRSALGARQAVSLPPDLVSALRSVARAHDATLYMALLAGFNLLLRELTGSDDIAVGSHVAIRDRVECEAMIGPFVNTLVLRTRFDGVTSFADLIGRVRATTVEALHHSGTSYDRLVRLLNPTRDPGRNAIYDVSFQLRNFPRASADDGTLRIEQIDVGNGIARCDLDVMAEESDRGLGVAFDYAVDLFEPATIARMATRFEAILRAATADPSMSIAAAARTIVPAHAAVIAASRPLTPTEAKLAAIWAGVLDAKDFEADDDFFAVGGHSLRAVVCASRVREAFGIELPVVAFFQTPTLADLAARIESAAAPIVSTAIVDAASRAARLSPAQERLWFLDRYEADTTVYNVVVARRLLGPLDAARLERAINVVVGRHAVLRTRYPSVDGVPVVEEVPAEAALVPIAIIEANDLSAADRDARIAAEVGDAAAQRFDLAVLPLLRPRLLRLDATDHALVITMHHIVCDEWSIRILMDELSVAYASDSGATLSPLRSQYVDYASRQRNWLAGDAPAAEAAYWKQHLAGAPVALALPTDRPRPAMQTFRGARVPLALSFDVVGKLQAIGRQERSTDFMTTLALFALLLTRWSRQRDLVIGTPVAARDRPDDQALIGYLLNTLPLRIRVPEDGTFRDLLACVRESAVGGLSHQALPFDRIIEAVRPPRDVGHSPLFQVMFVLRTEGDGRLALPGVETIAIDGYSHGAKFDLSLMMSQTPHGIGGAIEFNTDLFDVNSIRALATRYVALAEAVARGGGEASLDALCLADDAERQTILHAFNRPASAATGTVLDLWDEQVRRAPQAVAVTFGDRSLSYAELDGRANALAGELVRRGITDEARVGLYVRRSTEAMAALLGVLKAGAAYVPLDPTYPPARLALMLDDASILLVITESSLANEALLAGRDTIELDRAWPAASSTSLPKPTPDDLAYVLYTSGSTGRPKGVAMSHGPAWHLARWQRAHSSCGAGSRTLQFTSLNFDVSFQEIFATWCAGGTLVLVDELTRRDPDALLRHIVDARVDRLFLPFVALHSLAEAACKPGAPRASLREVMTAGEQLRVTPSIATWFASMSDCKLTNQYGPTETHVINTSLTLAGEPTSWPTLPAIGRPIDRSRLYVLDERRALLPVGTPGELYIAGACLAREYLNRPDLTAAAFFNDPYSDQSGARMYRTGDVARWNHDGTIQYLGRVDGQLKVQGYRVEPGEVEDALSRFPGIRQTAVVARDDASGTKRLIAYVVGDGPLDVRALRRHLSTSLPAYMVPAAFVSLDAMPLTASNKIDRGALPDPAGHAVEEGSDGEPTNDVERALVEIWRDVLGRSRVGVRDNFFEIGGQSLLAVRLFAQIERRFGRALPLSTLFASPTIAQLTPLLAAISLSAQATSRPSDNGVVIALQPRGDRPPLFCLAGVNGHVFSYRALAERMGPSQPVYGLQVEGLEGDREAMTKLEEIAAFLLRHVRRVQPRGPYALIGYSFGGTVAYEMAQQLRAAGERVRMLAMLDTFAAPPRRRSFVQRVAVHARRAAAGGPANACRYLGRTLTGGNRPIALAGEPVTIESAAVMRAIRRVRAASETAMRRYEPRPYDGTVTLFRASIRPAWHDFVVEHPMNGWETLARSVDVHPIDGTHLTMLDGDRAGAIADVLRGRLNDGWHP